MQVNETMLDQLYRIPNRELVKVSWLDASTSRNVDLRRLPVANHYVETRRTTVGTLVCIQRSKSQPAWHVVLEMDTEDRGSTIRSVPLCLVYKIIAPSLKSSEAIEKVDNFRRAKRSEKRISHFKDGGLKIID